MSKRKQAPAMPSKREERPPARALPPLRPRLLLDAGALLAVFVVVTLLAELLGAVNLGVAIGVGTIAYAVALMWLMLKR